MDDRAKEDLPEADEEEAPGYRKDLWNDRNKVHVPFGGEVHLRAEDIVLNIGASRETNSHSRWAHLRAGQPTGLEAMCISCGGNR